MLSKIYDIIRYQLKICQNWNVGNNSTEVLIFKHHHNFDCEREELVEPNLSMLYCYGNMSTQYHPAVAMVSTNMILIL